jgi:hypothetical protein
MLISSERPEDEAALTGTQRLSVWGDVSEKRDIYCVPANSDIEMFSEDGASPAAQQDVYTLSGENTELSVGKLTLPGSKKHGSKPMTITARKPALNTTRPQTSPAVICTPFLSNRSVMLKELRRQKKYSAENTPAVLSPNTMPLHMSDKYLISKKEGPLSSAASTGAGGSRDGSDFRHLVQQSCDIVDMF